MRQIPLSSSLLVYLEEMEFTEAALSAHEDTKDLASVYRDELESWEKAFKSYREARRAIVRADAMVSVCNQTLDELTTRFSHVVLVEVNGDRKSTLFRRFFPIAPSELVRQSLRKQCEHTRNVMVSELKSLPDQSPLKAFATQLDDRASRALDALDARAKVGAERATVAYDVEEWKEGVNRLRLSTYAALLQIAAERNLGKSFADSFFRAPRAQAPEGELPQASSFQAD